MQPTNSYKQSELNISHSSFKASPFMVSIDRPGDRMAPARHLVLVESVFLSFLLLSLHLISQHYSLPCTH